MNTNDTTIELPADEREAVRLLRHELHEARRRLAEASQRAAFRAYSGVPLTPVHPARR